MEYVLLKYLHFTGIFLVVGSLFAEAWMVRATMNRSELKTLGKIDGIYGLASIITVGAGLVLWLSDIGKPPEFYQTNGLVYIKLAIFTLVGLMSIYPTVFFMKQRQSKKHPNGEEAVEIPGAIKKVILLRYFCG